MDLRCLLAPFYYKTGRIGQIGSAKLVLPKWHKYVTPWRSLPSWVLLIELSVTLLYNKVTALAYPFYFC